MSSIRLWHTYLGVLIAPSVLFFALTGALQLFGLHEAHGSYAPPPLVEKLSSLHKDQVFAIRDHDDHAHDAGPSEKSEESRPAGNVKESDEHEEEGSLGTILLKCYFLVVSLALTTSTLLGLWMGLRHAKRVRAVWWLLAAGAVLPAALAFF